MMMTRFSMFLFSGAIGLCLSGCAATSPTMRAQSPNASFAGYANEMGYADAGCPPADGGYTSDWMPVECHSGMCQSGGSCPQGCGCDRCLNVPFHPVHRNFHTYDRPQGLSYPQENAAPASYQYPYYTTRGPTDFFMQ